jgi:hypothetical protein
MTDDIKYRDAFPKDYKPSREWQGVNLDDIDHQWKLSKEVHPSFGQQLGHFAAGIDHTLKERNHDTK